MATLEQIEEGIRRAHAAGDAENVRKLGEAYRQMQARQGEAMDGVSVPSVPSAAPQAPDATMQPPSLGGDVGRGLSHGFMQGLTFGFNDEIQGTLMSPIEMAIDAAQGKPFDPGRSWNQAVERNRQADAAAAEAAPIANTIGNIAGGVGTGMGLANGGVTLMKGAAPTIGSMAGRGALEGAAYGGLHGLGTGTDDKVGDALKGAAVGGVLGGALGGIGGAVAGKSAQVAAGTVDDLKTEATALYEAARQSGAVLPQQQSAQMAASMRNIAAGEGIITPTGRINESYQKLAALIRSFDDYGTGPLTVDQMQSVRRLIGGALKSPDGDERRIAMEMMEAFHGYLDPISPQIAQANQIYHRAMNADSLETLVEVARQKSGQYGRSFDATLREQFGNLQRQIIKGEVRGYSPEEIAAIGKVAQGGNVENFLRQIGKVAPSGLLSGATSLGGPLAVGTMVGNPVAGAAVGAGLAGTGMAARAGANAMTGSNAQKAIVQALLGAGVKPMGNQAVSPVVQALIAAGGGQVPEVNHNILRALALN
jgi:hypothetical protein